MQFSLVLDNSHFLLIMFTSNVLMTIFNIIGCPTFYNYIFLFSKYISKYLFSDIFKLKKYYFVHHSQFKIIDFQNTVSTKSCTNICF